MYSYQEVTYFTTDAIFVVETSNLESLKLSKEIQEVVIAEAEKLIWTGLL